MPLKRENMTLKSTSRECRFFYFMFTYLYLNWHPQSLFNHLDWPTITAWLLLNKSWLYITKIPSLLGSPLLNHIVTSYNLIQRQTLSGPLESYYGLYTWIFSSHDYPYWMFTLKLYQGFIYLFIKTDLHSMGAPFTIK
jgi:hypothetical protein